MDTIIENERRLKQSRIYDVFTPSSPIKSAALFCGREKQVESIIQNFGSVGNHVLLYGDRGVGKTSLALCTCNIALSAGIISKKICKSCDSNDTFASIMEHILQNLGIEIVTKHEKISGANIGIEMLNISKSCTEEINIPTPFFSPSRIADLLSDHPCVVVLDEFDVIQDASTKRDIAQLMKQISDRGCKVIIVVVGIASNANELLSGHQSVTRCLREIKLNRMSDDEICRIITNGEDRLGIKFEEEVKQKIVKASMGFPYFAHLLCLESAKEAIINEQKLIDNAYYQKGIGNSINQIEQTFKDKYFDAIGRNHNEDKRRILLAASMCNPESFTARDLREKYESLFGTTIEQLEINNAMSKAITETQSSVIHRIRKGLYRFNDPRMPCFIQLMHNRS